MSGQSQAPVSSAMNAYVQVRQRIERAQNDPEMANDDNEAKAAARALFEAFAGIFRAYVAQYVDADGLPIVGQPRQEFPPEVARIFAFMVEGWLAGHLDKELADLLGKRGARRRHPMEQADIEAACRYMQAATGGSPIIRDRKPISQVAQWFGVNRATAQSWKRAERRDLLKDFLNGHADEQRAQMITALAIRAGRRLTLFGRGHQAIARRTKGVK